MAREVKDRRGEKYGRLSPLSYFFKENNRGKRIVFWVCNCDCGTKDIEVRGMDLGRGVNSCGCIRTETNREKAENNKTHGMTKTRFYKIWRSIIDRCDSNKHESYIYYGKKGISYDKSWKTFENFYIDMYEDYTKHIEEYGEGNTSIDRIDVHGNYTKDNCRWATWEVQSRNKTTNKPFVAFHSEHGEIQANVIADLASIYNLDASTISECLKGKRKSHKGWTFKYT